MTTSSWWAKKLNNEPARYSLTIPAQAPSPVRQTVPQQQSTGTIDPQRPANAEITMGEAMRIWKGGEAHRKEGHLACPSCGSTTGYTAYSGMAAGSVRVNGQTPRPHCFECGYNGSFAQGLESSWA